MTTTIEQTTVTVISEEDAYKSVVPKNIGHLVDDPVEFECPACHQKCMTRVAHEAVTCLQKTIAVLNCCLCCTPIKWNGRFDVNHYCSKCGCYIGRKIQLSWYKRKLFRIQNSEIEAPHQWQKFKKVEKEHLDKSKQKHTVNMESKDLSEQEQPK